MKARKTGPRAPPAFPGSPSAILQAAQFQAQGSAMRRRNVTSNPSPPPPSNRLRQLASPNSPCKTNEFAAVKFVQYRLAFTIHHNLIKVQCWALIDYTGFCRNLKMFLTIEPFIMINNAIGISL